MRRVCPLLLVLFCGLPSPRPSAGAGARPTMLLFRTTQGEGADKDLAASTTKAVRNYFRDTQKVEPLAFDRESPTVARAIMENKLTADKVDSYSSQSERLEVAKILSFDYAAGAEVSVKDTIMTVKLWLGKVNGGKRDKWEATGTSVVAGTAALDRDNAMQVAASSVVLNVAGRAFASLPQVAEPAPASDKETTAIGGGQAPQATERKADDYAARAEAEIKAGNIALAIEQYQKAVNADPTNGALRLKLAKAYSAKGMYDDAERELAAAANAGAKADEVSAEKGRIAKLRSGETSEQPQEKPGDSTTPAQPEVVPSGSSAAGAVAKMSEGDKLWREGKPDEAAEAYKASIKLDPKDWRARERLTVVNAWMSLFGESRKALAELDQVQPKPPRATVEKRYEMLRRAFDVHFATLRKQYDSAGANFEAQKTSRESYYNEVKGLALRLESMAKFLDAIPMPVEKEPANLHRSLACGLMAQAASSLLDFLESNSDKAKSNAATFAAQAKKETEEAEKLEGNKVIVTK